MLQDIDTQVERPATGNLHSHNSAVAVADGDKPARRRNHPGERPNEKIGGGYFVFKRGSTTGRIKTKHGGMPFEHPTFAQARQEAIRLQRRSGERYDIFARVYTLDEQEAAALAATDLTED